MSDEFGIQMFEDIVNCLWRNREQCVDDYVFDFPEYGGLPTRIANKISSQAVDTIQELYSPHYMSQIKRKSTFRKLLKDELFILAR